MLDSAMVYQDTVTSAAKYLDQPLANKQVHPYEVILQQLTASGMIDFYYVGGVASNRAIGTGTIVASNWPNAYRQNYYENRRFVDDPVVRYLRSAKGTVLPSELATAFQHSAHAQHRIDEARDHGLALPLCFIIGPPSHAVGSVTFRRKEPYAPGEVLLLSMLAPAIHRSARLAYLGQTSRSGEIVTRRERECIAWSSLGKSSWEIGEILGIAKQTVDVHLKSAIHKLGAASRAHAVAEAVRLGLVD